MIFKQRAGAVAAGRAAGNSGGQVVVIDSGVLETGGHIFGNLFQRLYHSIDRLRRSDEPTAYEIEASARLLEDCVQLLMDYTSPGEPALQRLNIAEVVESLARQLEQGTGSPLTVDCDVKTEQEVMVDPGRLSRAYGLLADCLCADAGPQATVCLKALVDPVDALSVTLSVPREAVRDRTSVAALQWAVAVRLIEIHGGSLSEHNDTPGEIRWKLVLPLRS